MIIGLLLAAAVISSDAKLFPKFKFSLFKKSVPEEYEEHPKIVEIVKHVPVIQKVNAIEHAAYESYINLEEFILLITS